MHEILQTLSPLAQNYAMPQTPVKMRQMAASGKLPLPPQQMVLLLYLLAQDEDESVAQTAAQSFQQQPESVITVLLRNTGTHPALLDFIAKQFSHDANKLQAVLLHSNTPDTTFAWLAKYVKGTLLELIIQNQQRQTRHAGIVQHLLQNPSLPAASRAKVIEFALREKIATGLSPEELRPYVADGLVEELTKAPEAPAEEDDEALPSYVIEEIEETPPTTTKPNEEEPDKDEERLPLEKQIASWSVSKRIKAAMKGNKQVRTLLLRDPNRLVCTAVMKNPRITEAEVIKIAANRGVSDDVIREIIRNREWMKVYTIKLNLANNPKCPVATSMRLLNHLRSNDLRHLGNNKNIPSALAKAAKKLSRSRGR